MKQQQLSALRMHSLQEYFFSRANEKITQAKLAGQKVINLGVGNPDLPPPKQVIECLRTEILKNENHLYPGYAGLPEFRQAISQWYKENFSLALDADTHILPVNGSKQGIVYLTLALAGPGDLVLLPNPGYSAYEKAAVIAGASPRYYTLTAQNQYLPDLKALAKEDLSGVKLMWLNYPHNPTGATISQAELEEVAQFAREKNIILINDNPYSHITFENYQSPSLLQCSQDTDLFVEFSSMSKTYNMPGWRIGWVAGNSQLISLVKNMYSNIETGQFIPLQKAATLAFSTPTKWITERNLVYAERRKLVTQLLEKLDCVPYHSLASLYVWAKLPSQQKNAEEYVFSLLERTGMFLAPGTAFGSAGEGFVRAAICQPQQLLVESLQRLE